MASERARHRSTQDDLDEEKDGHDEAGHASRGEATTVESTVRHGNKMTAPMGQNPLELRAHAADEISDVGMKKQTPMTPWNKSG
jgi:hypothetical protein